MKKTLFELDVDLIPEFQEWKKLNRESFDLYDLAGALLDIEKILLAGRVLFPEFQEVDDMVFLDRPELREHIDHWKKGRSNLQVEAMLNHRHIHESYVEGPEAWDDQWLELGKLLKMCYESSLSRLYPDREFIVDLSEDSGPGDYVLTFYQPETKTEALEK
ncbi:hypothetical protein SAMN04487866_11746 [Thermoactinomyces sp. DSM 45891]|uniref:hypothetical protein n=1 Tax=Thermoactinomyces sp. DSM 45891 TaxID=1761907 RepID=UPI00091DDAD9|nr:hypothetical protein [Thermoactinomyces sp. DSM 45891]SFX68260.1 hypothetical protein SAMN04487866_11746 [Thermoactinomyces sp. DSM 45891]